MQSEAEEYTPGDEYFDEDFDYEAYGESLDGEDWSVAEGVEVRRPVLAVVGRPNVGKSTLVNRVLGRREAVVQDVPGVTRDRVSYDAHWNGRQFTLVDTGGWERDVEGMAAAVAFQAEAAIHAADAVLFVVDATVGITDTDEAVVRVLRKSKKPVILAANKVDDQRFEADAAALWNLGLGEPFPVSALHGRGSGDLLDAVLDALPETPALRFGEPVGGPRRVALVGKPNVGKSSLLNKLAGSERVVVDATAGTTRDPVDELIDLGGKTWRFVDTAGIRRRVHQTQGADFYASLRTQGAIEKAEVAVVLIDASDTLAEQDLRIITMVAEAGRALVIAYNKWDLMDEERRFYLEREIERDLVQVQWAPRRQHRRQDRPPHRQARPGPGGRPGGLGHPGPHRQAERLPGDAGGRAPAPRTRRQAAPNPVRDAGVDPPAPLRPVRLGLHRGRLPPLHRAPAARGVRLRGVADPAVGEGAAAEQGAEAVAGRACCAAAAAPSAGYPAVLRLGVGGVAGPRRGESAPANRRRPEHRRNGHPAARSRSSRRLVPPRANRCDSGGLCAVWSSCSVLRAAGCSAAW